MTIAPFEGFDSDPPPWIPSHVPADSHLTGQLDPPPPAGVRFLEPNPGVYKIHDFQLEEPPTDSEDEVTVKPMKSILKKVGQVKTNNSRRKPLSVRFSETVQADTFKAYRHLCPEPIHNPNEIYSKDIDWKFKELQNISAQWFQTAFDDEKGLWFIERKDVNLRVSPGELNGAKCKFEISELQDSEEIWSDTYDFSFDEGLLQMWCHEKGKFIFCIQLLADSDDVMELDLTVILTVPHISSSKNMDLLGVLRKDFDKLRKTRQVFFSPRSENLKDVMQKYKSTKEIPMLGRRLLQSELSTT